MPYYSLNFEKENNNLICSYTPEGGAQYVLDRIYNKGECTIKYLFTIKEEHITNQEDPLEGIDFSIGKKIKDYYLLDCDIFGFENKFYLHENLKIERNTFITHRNINILSKIDRLINSDVYIGGEETDAIPASDFSELISNFPNTSELNIYSHKQIERRLKNYLNFKKNYQNEYEKYMKKKHLRKCVPAEEFKEMEIFENEFSKYEFLKTKMESMLKQEKDYPTERDWQNEIMKIVTLLFPKYIDRCEEVMLKTLKEGQKRPDIILIDGGGNVDIIEIKKPSEGQIMRKSKNRENFIPSLELFQAVMQTEKYIFHLTSESEKWEKKILAKFSELGKTQITEINIRNPIGIIIMGRTNQLDEEQLRDFEIAKRKYKNIVDIISYDDLLNRLDNLLNHFKKKLDESTEKAE